MLLEVEQRLHSNRPLAADAQQQMASFEFQRWLLQCSNMLYSVPGDYCKAIASKLLCSAHACIVTPAAVLFTCAVGIALNSLEHEKLCSTSWQPAKALCNTDL